MSSLTISNIDEDVVARLRHLADRHGRSVEDEARQLILDKVAETVPLLPVPGESAWDVIQRLKAECGGGGDIPEFDRSQWQDRPVDFGE